MSEILKVTVTDPTTNKDTYGTYVGYKITTESSRPDLSGLIVVERRRYSDFSWLNSALSFEFPGCILPPLPEKQVIGRFSSEFIESRRRALERYLQRVAKHPDLSYSTSFTTFLQEPDDSVFTKFKDDLKNGRPKSTTSTFQWIEGTVNSFTGTKLEERSAADHKIEEICNYVHQLEKQLNTILKHSESLVKRGRELSQATFELGQSLTFLGQSEGDALGAGLTQMGTTFDTVSALTCTYAENQTIRFLEPLDEYTRIIQCIRTAVLQRNHRKTLYAQALADLEVKAAAYRKLVAANDPKKELQLKAKEGQVQQGEKVLEEVKSDFEKVTERLLQEFEFFKDTKGREIKETVVQFVLIQMEYHGKLEEEWSQVLPRLQSISVNSPDALQPPPIPSTDPDDQFSNSNPVSNPFQDFEDTGYYTSGANQRLHAHLSAGHRTSSTASNFHEEDAA